MKRSAIISVSFSLLAIGTTVFYASNKENTPMTNENVVAIECAAEEPAMLPMSFTAAALPPSDHKIQLAILLDTSGSMSGLIDQAKSQLWNIVNELVSAEKDEAQPQFELALYEYGNDALSMRKNYIRQIKPFTSDIDEVSNELFALTTNGGEEYCGAVIKSSIEELGWSDKPDDLKIVYIAGNEPFTQGPIDATKECQNANANQIVINTIFCGDYQEGIRSGWKNGSALTAGAFFTIDHDQAAPQIASPYDTKLAELNGSLNKTMAWCTAEGADKFRLNLAQDSLSALQGASSCNSRNAFKSGKGYVNQWDLTDLDEKALELVIADSKLGEFSDNVKAETKDEILDNVIKLKVEKELLRQQIAEETRKREAFVQEALKETAQGQTLGESIIESLRVQGKEKNFEFKN